MRSLLLAEYLITIVSIKSFTFLPYPQVGGQIYNIQLTEDQKKIMIEQMMGMPQAEQQRYIVEQQSQILATAFKSQNAQTDQSQSEVPSPKPPRHKYGVS